jgi:2-polyprenyl-3-methyl-5-hydroxy-6-metoxy-1,4-benzoquinol methylase
MQKTVEQAGQWEAIWARRGLLDSFIDAGRTIYNFFWRRILRRYTNSQTRLLELGCGRASLTLTLAPEIKSLSGIDISDVAVRQAVEHAKSLGVSNARFAMGDCTKLSLGESFDLVWSQGLIEHFEDSTDITRAHYDALTPGGVALISVPYRYSYHTVWYGLTRPKALRWMWPWTEQKFFNGKTLLALGKSITPHARVFLLQPFPLGIIFLELRKPAH